MVCACRACVNNCANYSVYNVKNRFSPTSNRTHKHTTLITILHKCQSPSGAIPPFTHRKAYATNHKKMSLNHRRFTQSTAMLLAFAVALQTLLAYANAAVAPSKKELVNNAPQLAEKRKICAGTFVVTIASHIKREPFQTQKRSHSGLVASVQS